MAYMTPASFSFGNLHLTDEEFWRQLRELDSLAEELPGFTGFSITAKSTTGKEVNVPFVRFRKAMPQQSH